MHTLRVLLAIFFAFLIVWGVGKYYNTHQSVRVNNPLDVMYERLVWLRGWGEQQLWLLDAQLDKDIALVSGNQAQDTQQDLVQDDDNIRQPSQENSEQQPKGLHPDFVTWSLTQEELDRVMNIGVVWWATDGRVLWLHYCDFDATYCQISYDKGIVYDYFEAFPQDLQYIFKSFPPTTRENDLLPHFASLCTIDKNNPDQFFDFYGWLYKKGKDVRENINELIALWRSFGIDDLGTCLDTNNYFFLIQQETKLAKRLFTITSLPTNIFINKQTWDWIKAPGYYETEEVVPAISWAVSR